MGRANVGRFLRYDFSGKLTPQRTGKRSLKPRDDLSQPTAPTYYQKNKKHEETCLRLSRATGKMADFYIVPSTFRFKSYG